MKITSRKIEKFLLGGTTTTLTSNNKFGNFMNSQLGNQILSASSNVLNNIVQTRKNNEALKLLTALGLQSIKLKKVNLIAQANLKYLENLANGRDRSPLVNMFRARQSAFEGLGTSLNEINRTERQFLLGQGKEGLDNTMNTVKNLVGSATKIGLLAGMNKINTNMNNNKSSTLVGTTTTNNTTKV